MHSIYKHTRCLRQVHKMMFSSTSDRTNVPEDAAALHGSQASVSQIKNVLERRRLRRQHKQNKTLKKKREHVVIDAPDMWPVHKRPVAYCPNAAEADEIIGGIVFGDELPEFVALRVERRLSEYNPPAERSDKVDGVEVGKQNVYVPHPIACITVSTENHVVVMHVVQWGDYREWAGEKHTPNLTRLLKSNRVMKVASNAYQITKALQIEFNLETSGFVDLGEFAKEAMHVAQTNGVWFQPTGFSFHDLANLFFAGRYPRPLQTLMSNWHILPLSSNQLVFSSNQAHTTLQLYNKISALKEKSLTSMMGPYHAVHVVINTLVLRWAVDKESLQADFKKNSDFYFKVQGLLQKAFRDFGGIDWFWFTCAPQTLCVAFTDPAKAEAAVASFAGHRNIIVTDREVDWEDCKKEFQLRYAAHKKPHAVTPQQYQD